ncbi:MULTISPECIES: 3-hydroxyacyl-ACP dehydratase FabZ family protein [Actinosynnema]|uniref:3-hydroxyacyl-ACP dehydratase FabZ family protein n=1 Tax=Actinosynnema TaxID=40566 RepID=UPI0020A3ACD0|nr:3-hydroxyacyl-ACP dehydratase FabZ family protein [Actinosynnema pretiosum]MCP2099800.1 3-hydroxyacyl-[acyl-carrier-protein] dehydratase [Actinosynnema pretiosum]
MAHADTTTPEVREPKRAMGFTELKRWLRHRHPMIYVDRVEEYVPGSHLVSVLSVSGNNDAIAGHFPERAIYPGSHLMQAFAQSGIVLYQLETSPLGEDELTLIGSVKSRFTKVVVPGDRVLLDVRADRLVSGTFFFSCRATVDGKLVAAFRGTLVRVRTADLGEQLW